MTDPQALNAAGPTNADSHQWPPDVVFAMLGDPIRRRLLEALAGGAAMSATQLGRVVGRSQDATLKQLTRLSESGLVVHRGDAQDRRRQMYSLSADVRVIAVEGGKDVDLGCCLLRIRQQ